MTDLPIGQLFLLGFDGESLPAPTAALLSEKKVSGAILFSRNISSLEQVVALNTELVHTGTEDLPTLIAVDQEGGRVQRLRDICTFVPAMRVLGRASHDDPDLPYRVGAMMARELGALGFHYDFAPVVDVDTNPNNPVIGERAFSRDPAVVAQHACAFLRGMQQAGVAACAKHFPGHGDTDTDSHLELPRVGHDLQRLHDVELLPFRAAIAAGVASIMTAHVLFPAYDQTVPATLSAPVLTDLLRHTLGFSGLIVSDDLEMKGLADHFSIEEMVVGGLNAGVDLFLICHRHELVEEALDATARGLADGRISHARVEEALARVRLLKERFVGAMAAPSLAEAKQIVGSAPHQRLVERLLAHQDDGDERRQSSFVDVV